MSENKCMPFYQDIDGFRIPGCFLSEAYRSGLQYRPEPGDFFIATFPKCGTTWAQTIVSLIYNKGVPVADYVEFNSRTPFLEMLGTEGIDLMVRPGSIKVHLPYHLTPMSPDAKYLYVVRNPKDTLVSFYHHTCTSAYKFRDGKFNDYFEIFLNGENDFGDYFDHVLSWYEHRDDPNVMFLTYEELKLDTAGNVRKIAKFMGDEYEELLEEEDVLNNVLKHSSVEHMKMVINESFKALTENDNKLHELEKTAPAGLKHVFKLIAEQEKEGADKFRLIRKGMIGDWRNNFTEDQASRMDAKIEAKLKGTDLYNYWKSIDCI